MDILDFENEICAKCSKYYDPAMIHDCNVHNWNDEQGFKYIKQEDNELIQRGFPQEKQRIPFVPSVDERIAQALERIATALERMHRGQ